MTRKKTSAPDKGAAGRSLAPIDVLANYNFGPANVDGVSVYHVDDRHPRGDGPWTNEADKTAWWDEKTGLACIIRRAKNGSLAGFVAVPRGHDLFGFDHVAIRPLGVVVHGGLNYSEPCNESEVESVSVCHVPRVRTLLAEQITGSRLDVDHELWWFGFSCDHSYDFVPKPNSRPGAGLKIVHGHDVAQTYRDEGYVYTQVVQLAAQLKALGDGDDMPGIAFPPPPLGLDRKEGR